MFRGASKIKLDAKGRMAMPTRYREQIQDRCQGNLVVTVDHECLLIYPYPDWEVVEQKVMSLPNLNERTRELQRLVVGHATEMEMDSHGRLLLPRELREVADISRDAMLVGQGNKFELWDEALWNKRRDEWLAVKAGSLSLPAELESLSL